MTIKVCNTSSHGYRLNTTEFHFSLLIYLLIYLIVVLSSPQEYFTNTLRARISVGGILANP